MEIRLLKAQEIECRVGQNGRNAKNVPWCSILLYKDARCDYKVLDETFGPLGWQCHYEVINNNLFCTIEVYDQEHGVWVKKQNVGTESTTEKEKGEASDALKRAAVAVGIGRELYTAPQIFINLSDDEVSPGFNGKERVKTRFSVAEIEYDESRCISKLVIVDGRGTVRFSTEQRKSQPKDAKVKEVKKPAITAAIKKAIASCTKREELVAVWNNNNELHSEEKFVDLFKAKMSEINQTKTA